VPTDCLLLGAAYKCTYLLTNLLDSALTVTHTPSCKQTETRQQATNRFYNKVNKRAIFCAFASRVSSFIVSCLSCFSLCLLTTLSVKGYCTSLHIRTKNIQKDAQHIGEHPRKNAARPFAVPEPPVSVALCSAAAINNNLSRHMRVHEWLV